MAMTSSYTNDWTNPRSWIDTLGFGNRMSSRYGRYLGSSYYGGSSFFGSLALFGAGLAVGAGLALLTAPKPGRQLRDDLSRRANQLGDRFRRNVQSGINDMEHEANNIGSSIGQ